MSSNYRGRGSAHSGRSDTGRQIREWPYRYSDTVARLQDLSRSSPGSIHYSSKERQYGMQGSSRRRCRNHVGWVIGLGTLATLVLVPCVFFDALLIVSLQQTQEQAFVLVNVLLFAIALAVLLTTCAIVFLASTLQSGAASSRRICFPFWASATPALCASSILVFAALGYNIFCYGWLLLRQDRVAPSSPNALLDQIDITQASAIAAGFAISVFESVLQVNSFIRTEATILTE
jgi:hypothetical protein